MSESIVTPSNLLRLFQSGKALFLFFLLLGIAYGGMQIFIIYHTTLRARAPDWWGHVSYIGYVLRYWNIPDVHENWQAYQPPLYYFAAALVVKWAMWSRHYSPLLCARMVSLVFLTGFLTYGLLFITQSLRSRATQILAGLMLFGWPLLLCVGGRVSNEPMIYPFWAATYFYAQRWFKGERDADLLIALGLCAVMILIKTTALVPLCTVGCIMLYRAWVRHYSLRRYLRMDIIAMILLIMLMAAFNFARPIYYNLHHDVPVNLVIGNIGLDRYYNNIKTTNDISKFVTLNFSMLVNAPYWDFFKDETGRQYFWNSYLKSSMFGFEEWPGRGWAMWLDIMLVAIASYALLGSFLVHNGAPLRIAQVAVVIAVGAQIIDRLMIGTVTTQDGRLTLPVIVPFIALVGLVTEGLGDHHRLLKIPGLLLMATFFSLEALFIYANLVSLKDVGLLGYYL